MIKTNKTKEQLLIEIKQLKGKISMLEKSAAEHTKKEITLKENVEKYHDMILNLKAGFFSATLGGKLQVYNTELINILGLDPKKDNVGIELSDFWQYPAERKNYINEFIKKGFIKNILVNARKKDGEKIIIQVNSRLIKDEKGNPSMIEGTLLDITERIQAEEALKKRDALLIESQHIAQIGSWELDLTKNTLYWSDEVYRIFDLEPGQFKATYEEFLKNVHPDDIAFVDKAYTDSLKNKIPYEIVHRLLLKDGTLKYVNERCKTYYDEEGNAVRSIGTVQDITERKYLENKLEDSEEKYRILFENMLNGFAYHKIIKDKKGKPLDYRFVEINHGFEKLTGLKREDIIGNTVSQVLPGIENDPADWIGRYGKLDQKGDETRFESYSEKLDKWFAVYAYCPKEEYFATIFEDITKRKIAEKHNLKLSTAVKQSPSVIAITDLNGNLEYVNPKFSELTGYKSEEVLGQNPRILKSDKQPKKVYKELWNTLSSGKEWHGEFLNKKRNGELFWEYASISPIFDNNGKITNYIKVAEDITERKKTEEALLKSEEELRAYTVYFDTKVEEEKKRIASEIHDGIGQLLTILKMDLLWIKKKIPEINMQINDKFDSMKNMIDSGVQMVQDISMRLRPGMLDDLGFVATIRWELIEFQKRTGIKCVIFFEPNDLKIDFDRSTTLYRVILEVLTNVYRHSGATQVDVSLIKKQDELILRVQDNGKGITKNDIASSFSFGLIGIKERVKIWKGKVEIVGVNKKGTIVTTRIPL